jgi:RimJ/RimL family protein N-acetyltransferase
MILRSSDPSNNGCVDDTPVAEEEIIGECSLDENGEIGLMILPKYWRQGYGTDTVKQLMKIAHDLGLETVTAQTDRENKACVGLLRSMGFTAKGMGWFIPEEAIHSTEAGLGMSRGMIMFSKDLEAAR